MCTIILLCLGSIVSKSNNIEMLFMSIGGRKLLKEIFFIFFHHTFIKHWLEDSMKTINKFQNV